MEQSGLNSYPYYSKIFKNSNFVKTKTKGSVHIYEVEILNSGYYTADNNIEVAEPNTGETTRDAIAKDIRKKTQEQIEATDKVIREFEEACKGKGKTK